MVANTGKFQIKFLGSKTDNSKIAFALENKQIKCKTKKVKLLGITIDEKLTFTNSTARIRRFLSTEQTKCLCEAYFMRAFKCCPFIWMFCNKTSI